MAYINWDSSKELGHPLIDDDHRAMIERINELVEVVFKDPERAAGSPERRIRIDAAIEALRKTTADHYASEEAIMEMAGYPGLAAHRRQHEDLLAEYARFSEFLHSPRDEMATQLVDFLRDWFEVHFRIWDASFVRWLSERPAD